MLIVIIYSFWAMVKEDIIMRKEYTTTEKIGFLYDSSIRADEANVINDLLDKFSDDDICLINRICEINFKIGFRVASELLMK